jgi:hypothetical protein
MRFSWQRNPFLRRRKVEDKRRTQPVEAQKKLRERLQARDGNFLDIVRKGENLNFGQWADFFLDNYSKPPVRELNTHGANLRATKHLKLAFATRRLVDLTMLSRVQ